jgi:hyperosmotically inducible periplasmic protein
MTKSNRLMFAVLTLCIVTAIAQRGFAQSASSSFHEAGESTENAGSSAGHAIVHAYHGTATATEDTAITGKVKSELAADSKTKSLHIHVTTVAGVVTLRGNVPSSEMSEHVGHKVAGMDGVKRVRNELHVRSASN